jgi:ABC-2 type transport system permease protein
MLHSVATKSLFDQRRALVAWAVSLALLVAMYVAIWPSIRDQPAMTDFLDSMPAALRSMLAMSGADMSTPIGYIKIEMLSLMAPLSSRPTQFYHQAQKQPLSPDGARQN